MAKISWKIWVLIFAVMASLLAIIPLDFSKGLEISSVEQNSTSFEQGLRTGQIITHIDGQQITSLSEYQNSLNNKFPAQENIILTITTKDNEFILFTNKTAKFKDTG